MTLFLGGVVLIASGGAVAFAWGRAAGTDRLFRWLVVGGCALVAAAAVRVLAGGDAVRAVIPAATPGGDWVFGIDALSAFFLICITTAGIAAALFGTAYLGPGRPQRPVGHAHGVLAVLLASLTLVVTAQAVVPFLGAWEIMAVSGLFLVITDHHLAEVRRAGLVYLIATHTGTLVLFAMFAVWAPSSGDWSFEGLAAGAAGGNALILTLAVIGFGFKAGLVPLHFWLPAAHAAAPAHVSGLLSGVVIKTGIYGILRVLALTGVPPAWWGATMLAIGATSAVLGVLWALAQHDLKRLLAYHSVENIGIIAMGIGVGALGAASDRPMVAVLGYGGAVLHTLNHALFKNLLFLGAGVVQRATGTRHLDALGGLARLLPRTWIGFLIGATAIIGVPPLNGFVSEWLVYLGLLSASQGESWLRLAVLGVPALALVGALALACFAKVAGVVFLGSPRTPLASMGGESDRTLSSPILGLAAACVLLGLVPVLGVTPATSAAAALAHADASTLASVGVLGRQATRVGVVALAIVAFTGALVLLRRGLLRGRVRTAETWGCGYPATTPRMQYTASSFAAPIVHSFGALSGVVVEESPGHFATHPVDPVLDGAVRPAWRRIHALALRLRPIQQGRLVMYLLYVMSALLVLLAWLALAG
jgi:formate hydrogenlyase subunit 3/multisubunit Na+/H+ antiporter MnhD subunit